MYTHTNTATIVATFINIISAIIANKVMISTFIILFSLSFVIISTKIIAILFAIIKIFKYLCIIKNEIYLCAPLLRCFFYAYSFVRSSELTAVNPTPRYRYAKLTRYYFRVSFMLEA